MISSYQHLVQASRKEPEPQRFLFVFCKAELPDDASAAERAAFERGEGGALMPVICVDKTPDEVPYFDVLAEESRATGQDWDMVFVAAMSGRGYCLSVPGRVMTMASSPGKPIPARCCARKTW